MPTAYPTAQASLQAALASAAANLATVEASGPWAAGVTMSIDGESYDWAGAKRLYQESIERYTRAIQILGGPYMVRSQGRP